MQQSFLSRLKPPKPAPKPAPPKLAALPSGVPPVRPSTRSRRTYLTRLSACGDAQAGTGQKIRGHHLRGDRPGHVTCPHCALGDVPAKLGARCTVPGCGAVVTDIKEAL